MEPFTSPAYKGFHRAEGSRRTSSASSIHSLSNNSNAGKSQSSDCENPITPKSYLCPSCFSPFDVTRRNIGLSGRIPLILSCRHTVCEECIRKLSFRVGKIVCVVCQLVTDVPVDSKLQDVLPLNYYLIGLILCKKNFSAEKLSLIPTGVKLKSGKVNKDNGLLEPAVMGVKCCLAVCNKIATINCIECNDQYCNECSITVHQNVPFLLSHHTESLLQRSFKVNLEKCPEHAAMYMEFFCKSCHVHSCCYCLIEKHEGHEKSHLTKLTDAETLEFNLLKEKATKVLKQLLNTQKLICNLAATDTSAIEQRMGSFFADLHGRLYLIERQLRLQVQGHQEDGTTSKEQGLNKLTFTIQNNVDELQYLLNAAGGEGFADSKLNLKVILEKLRNAENIPCYLDDGIGTESGAQLYSFSPDPTLENLEDMFTLEKSLSREYMLIPYSKIPDDLKVDITGYESSENECSKTVISIKSDNTSVSSDFEYFEAPRSKKVTRKGNGKEEVTVTHIETVDKFFVQKRVHRDLFHQICSEIKHTMNGTKPFENPRLSDICLVLYILKKKQEWCRGRIVDILANGNYKVFLLDYGNSVQVTKDKLRTIRIPIMKKPPLAIECKLYKPTNAEWSNDAHLHMAQIIVNKDTFMNIRKTENGVCEVELSVSTSVGSLTSIVDLIIASCDKVLQNRDNFHAEYAAQLQATKVAESSRCFLFKNSRTFALYDSANVTIIYAKNPHYVYVQMTAYKETYEKMMKSLNDMFRKLKSCVPVKGSYCLVEHSTTIHGQFHRAEVLEVDILNRTAEVFLVDLGPIVSVSWTRVKSVPESLSKLECQAIKVKMTHVEPAEDDVWQEEALLFFNKYIYQERSLKMVVNNLEPLEVAFFECRSQEDICLNALLVKSELAKSTGSISENVQWPRADKTDSLKDDDTGFMFLKQTFIPGLDSDCEDEEISGVKQPVDVVRAENPERIYIKFHKNQEQEKQLYKELQAHYGKEREYKDKWEVGEKCVVFDNEEKDYCRGVVTEKLTSKKYRVYLTDKGKEIDVCDKNIHIFNEYFSKFLPTVYKCHLVNIRPAGDQNTWSNMAVEFVLDIFKDHKILFVKKVLGFEPPKDKKSIPVEMWYSRIVAGKALEPSRTYYTSINKLLTKAGLAFKIKPPEPEVKVILKRESSDLNNPKIESVPEVENEKQTTDEEEKPAGNLQNDVSKKDELKVDIDPVDWNELIQTDDEDVEPLPAATTEWMPPKELPHTKFEAIVTCTDYGFLYIRDINLEPAYKDMESRLKEIFDQASPSPEITWKKGQICTVFFNDFWYRGSVVDAENPQEINIIMIDFGSDHTLPPKSLSPKVCFTDIEPFAVPVKLHNVFTRNNKNWSNSEYNILTNLITQRVTIETKYKDSSGIYLVEVYLSNGANLNDLLVAHCKNLTRLRSDVGLPVEEESDDDDVVIEDVRNYCGVVNALHFENAFKKNDENEVNTELEVTNNIFQFAELPEIQPNEKYNMIVINVIKHNSVVLDILGEKVDDECVSRYKEMEKSLKTAHRSQPVLDDVTVGTPCICPFSDDGLWYRGLVFNIDDIAIGYVLVYFVDYGNIDSVSCNDLRVMQEEWFNIPIRHCYAQIDIKLVDDKNLNQVLKHMQQLTGTLQKVEILCKHPLTVHIYKQDDGETLCYQELLDKGVIKLNNSD